MATRTMSEMKAHITARAVADAGFRENLIADPKAVVSAELGISIPEAFNIQVHEDNDTTSTLTLPPSDRLTEAELELAAGGVDVNWDTVNIS